MSIRQFQEWRAYSDLEPFDTERSDWQSAHVVQAITNLRRKEPIGLKECVLQYGAKEAHKTQTVEQQRAAIRATMDMLVGANKREPEKKRLRRK